MELYLDRFCTDAKMGTFGRLYMPGFFCYTVEKPWKNNERWLSCIPEGVYKLIPSRYYKHDYDSYELAAVPLRDRILIHKANLAGQVLGCIGLGTKLGALHGDWAVQNSRDAFEEWYRLMVASGETRHTISIEWTSPGLRPCVA